MTSAVKVSLDQRAWKRRGGVYYEGGSRGIEGFLRKKENSEDFKQLLCQKWGGWCLSAVE